MEINDPEYFRILRSLLPFLDFSIQKQFSIMLKLMELQYTMDYYQQPHKTDFNDTPEERSRKMLKSIRDACDPDKRSMFDMMLNAINLSSLNLSSMNPDSTNMGSTNFGSLNFGPLQSMMQNAFSASDPATASTSAAAPNPTSETDFTSKLKQDLTPEQQGMFDMLSNMLGGVTL